MLKKIILILILLTSPVLAGEINMTPQTSFSGFNNNTARTTYPKLNNTFPQQRIQDSRAEIMKPKSVREMGEVTLTNEGQMNYSQFPKNYDSSNMMYMQQGIQNGMQNMFMGY